MVACGASRCFVYCFLPALAQNGTASLSGKVRDITGAGIAGALATLRLVHEPYSEMRAKADDAGVYRFTSLAQGEYTLKLQSAGFTSLTVKGLALSAGEQRNLETLELEVGSVADCGGHAYLDSLRLLPAGVRAGTIRGRLVGTKGPITDATVTLLCQSGVCGVTKTDTAGGFEFKNLYPGSFVIRVTRAGYYPLDVPEFIVQEDTEATYYPIQIERCPHGNCDPLRRPKKRLVLCA